MLLYPNMTYFDVAAGVESRGKRSIEILCSLGADYFDVFRGR